MLQYPQLSTIDSDLLYVIRQRLGVMAGSKKRGRISDDVTDEGGCLGIQGPETDSVQGDVGYGNDAMLTCAQCAQPVSIDSIECTRCDAWMHWKCENLSEEVFEAHASDPDSQFVCLLCQSDIETLSDVDEGPTDMISVDDVGSTSGTEGAGDVVAAQTRSLTATLQPPLRDQPPVVVRMQHAHSRSVSPLVVDVSDFGLVQNSELSPPRPQTPRTQSLRPHCHLSANMTALAVDADGSRGRSSLTRPANSSEHVPQLPSGLNMTPLTDGSKTKKGDNSLDTSLKEDELRAKEKTLASKERRLRVLQKKLNSKEINLGDTQDRVKIL